MQISHLAKLWGHCQKQKQILDLRETRQYKGCPKKVSYV